MIGNSYQVGLISGLLRQAELRHQVVSNNIANVNTPGFRSMEITFDKVLAGNDLHNRDVDPAGIRGQIKESRGLSVRQDGNNVDIDRELGHLTKNAMHFETYSQLLASKMAMLRSAITGQ